MLANAKPDVDITLDAIPTDRNVREIIAVCAKHGLDYGRVESLAPFMHALHSDKHLAMTFWAAVARIERNNGTMPAGTLLEAIVSAVTSKSVDEVKSAGPSQQELVDQLSSMLAGEDILSPVGAGPLPPSLEEEPDVEVTARRLVKARKKLRAEPLEEQRNEAWEPRLTPIRNASLASEDKTRLVLEPEPVAPDIKPEAAADRPFVVPLARYAESTPRDRMTPKSFAVILILALIGAGGFLIFRTHDSPMWGRMGAAMHAGYSSAVAVWDGKQTATPAPATPVQSVSPPPAASPVIPATASGPMLNAPVTPRHPATSASLPPVAPSRTTPERAAIPNGAQVEGKSGAEASDSNDAGESDPAEVPRTVVRESTMKQYLLSSRVPVYPDEARDHHIAGNVVMEAVVSPTGAVDHLHVIDGDPALRRAALDAVSSWHYRPYMVDGQTTAVSTTISVYVGPEQ